MAARYFIDGLDSLYKGLTLIRARILMSGTTPLLQNWQYPNGNSGSTGSYGNASTTGGGTTWPAQYKQGSEGVRSVARTNTGLWTFVLQDNYARLLGLTCYQSLAGGVATIIGIGENTSISDLSTTGGSTIGVALLSAGSGAAVPAVADPATTTSVTITMLLQNSTAP